MGNLENTLKMWGILKNGNIVNKKKLAEKIEVSERQIERYKEALDQFCDIEVIVGRYGGYKLLESYLPVKELLSFEEIESLRILSNSIQYTDNKLLNNALNKINYSILNQDYDKVTEIIPYSKINSSIIRIRELQSKIYEAILEKREVIIEYYNNNGVKSKRTIEPYKCLNYKGEIYLVANCLLRNEIRFFKIVRIERLIVTNKKFQRKINIEDELEKYKKESIGIFGGKEYKIILEIYPPIANTIKERIWVDNQEIEEIGDGKIVFKATMKGEPEIISWILSMRSYVKVLEPKELVDKLEKELKKMIEILKK